MSSRSADVNVMKTCDPNKTKQKQTNQKRFRGELPSTHSFSFSAWSYFLFGGEEKIVQTLDLKPSITLTSVKLSLR